MDATEWAAIATWAGDVVMAFGATYTVVQVRNARAVLAETHKASEAAQDQAHHARESATAARLAAHAAVDSARSGRESVEIARATFDREERPSFESTGERQDDRFLVTATMPTGPPEIAVTVRWEASSEGPNKGGPRQFDHQTGTSSVYRLVRGDRIKVPVSVPSWADEATIKLVLNCTDVADKNREWEVPHVLEWRAPQYWATWR